MLPEGSREAMAEAFAHLLGNTHCLQRATQSCEWNVRGPFAAEAVSVLRRQAAERFRAQVAIACRIRIMGKAVIADESDLVLSAPDQAACRRWSEPGALVQILIAGHMKTITSIRAAADVAEDIDDRGSLVVLDARLVAHEGHVAQLEEFRR